ncbi:hypothetical protein CXB51_022345 [Gossypium anomalum]|uniref:Reverse transcriptase n=1 Tax=Gossypium anomalum TaxID=47600 RepID=A0A8J5Y5P9_9ROSI|nr:hypothetical protein CXB51_022345 [Gossypium anomalum]
MEFRASYASRMGFPDLWIERVMRCVTTVTYYVAMNGEVGNAFIPSRGLRQGDPISLYLFLIYGEGLSTLFRKATSRGSYFGDASVDEAKVIKDCLEVYATCSGQKVNFDKSEIFFSSNVDQIKREEEVLIRAVLQAIPLYAMNCFLLSSSKELSVPKEEGGMGFRDLAKFNIVLLAKQGWRLMENPSSLLTHLLRAKYYSGSNFMVASLRANPSFVWKSIWCAKGLLGSSLKWRIGSGTSVSIWQDYWLPGNAQRLISTDRVAEEADQIVSLPIPTTDQSNKVVWFSDNSSIYSVKSGYKMLLNAPNVNLNEQKLLNCVNLQLMLFGIACLLHTDLGHVRYPVAKIVANNGRLPLLFGHFGSLEINLYMRERCKVRRRLLPSLGVSKIEYQSSAMNLKHPQPRALVRWMPPPQMWVKVNIDAGLSVAKNEQFQILRTYLVRAVVTAEALAVIHGLQFALNLGFTKNLVRKFNFCRFQFIAREGNRAAHSMAVEGMQTEGDSFWVEDAPLKALKVADSDCRSSQPP